MIRLGALAAFLLAMPALADSAATPEADPGGGFKWRLSMEPQYFALDQTLGSTATDFRAWGIAYGTLAASGELMIRSHWVLSGELGYSTASLSGSQFNQYRISDSHESALVPELSLGYRMKIASGHELVPRIGLSSQSIRYFQFDSNTDLVLTQTQLATATLGATWKFDCRPLFKRQASEDLGRLSLAYSRAIQPSSSDVLAATAQSVALDFSLEHSFQERKRSAYLGLQGKIGQAGFSTGADTWTQTEESFTVSFGLGFNY